MVVQTVKGALDRFVSKPRLGLGTVETREQNIDGLRQFWRFPICHVSVQSRQFEPHYSSHSLHKWFCPMILIGQKLPCHGGVLS
jgi:hypothetical protein